MNFLDGSLFPENQEKLVITAAPYGPEWMPSDFPEDIPVTMEQQIQQFTSERDDLVQRIKDVLDGSADGDRERLLHDGHRLLEEARDLAGL